MKNSLSRHVLKSVAIAAAAFCLSGCVVEPYPAAPPPAPVAAAPGYYAAPCCYSYYEYPPYYYGGPAVGLNFGYGGGWGHHRWR